MNTLAYFMTWTTYGTWLPGDQRGWVNKHEFGIQSGSEGLEQNAKNIMKHDAVIFDNNERMPVDKSIKEVCAHKEWNILAVNVRTNHVHIVLTTDGYDPLRAMSTLKNFATRALRNKVNRFRDSKVWTKSGSVRYLDSRLSVNAAIDYVGNQ